MHEYCYEMAEERATLIPCSPVKYSAISGIYDNLLRMSLYDEAKFFLQ